MNTNPVKQLQSRYISGDQLSTDETTHLLQWLEETPGEREAMLLDGAIDNQLRCMARLDDEDSVETFVSATVRRAMPLEIKKVNLDEIKSLEEIRPRSVRSNRYPVYLCTIVFAFIGIASIWYFTSKKQQGDFGFARLANSIDLSWELLDDEKRLLQFSSGNAEIHFENGAIAELAAPAIIELRSPGKLFVENGTVTMNVPPVAVGFTVETPVARIIDLGTNFDVDVGESGSTEAYVRSGTVTFETNLTNLKQSAPIVLTEEGLNRATAVVSKLTPEIRSVSTTASGPRGQFFAAIHAEGKSVEFDSRPAFEDFMSRLNASLVDNPAHFHEKWDAVVRPTGNDTTRTDTTTKNTGTADTTKKDEIRTGDQKVSPGNKAREKLLKQLRSMREFHKDNPQMREMIERMIRQAEEHEDKKEK